MNWLIVILVVVGIVLVATRLRSDGTAEPAERRQWVVDEFARRKLRQTLLAVPIGVIVIPLLWAQRHPESGLMTLLLPAAFVVIMASVVFSYHNWRCPACGGYLGRYAWMQGRCPKCHTALR